MKKKILYLFACLSVICFFISCEDDQQVADNWTEISGDYWESLSGAYKGKMIIETEGIVIDTINQQAFILSDNRNHMNLKINSIIVSDHIVLNNISFPDVHFTKNGNSIDLWAETIQDLGTSSSGIISNIKLSLAGNITNDNINFVISAIGNTTRNLTLKMQGNKVTKPLSSDATIKKMVLNHPLIVGQPDISGSTIRFYVTDTLKLTDSTEIFIKPEFELAKGATISYPDSIMNFAKAAASGASGVKYTVWAEDSIHRTVYTLFLLQSSVTKFDINNWRNFNGWNEPTGDWATNNGFFHDLKNKGLYDGVYPVTRVKGYSIGTFGAQMRTVMIGLGSERRIYAGSFFQGSFDLAMPAPLNGPVYGINFTGKRPMKIKGFYKYIPGSDLYNKDSLVVDTIRRSDSCCIRAILYEAQNPDVILDSMDYLKDPKVVAIADLEESSGKLQKNFTEFNIYFKYIKSFFISKRYKIAIICTSSRDAIRFKGSPGSELTISDLEIMYSNK